MSGKIPVNVLVGSGFLYRLSDPSEVFFDIKTPDYGWRLFAGTGFFIGGQWIGETAINDRNPRDTFIREVNEELTFARPKISLDEMRELCSGVLPGFYQAPGDYQPTPEDLVRLECIKKIVSLRARHFRDYFIRTPEEAVVAAGNPKHKGKGDLTAHFSIFTVGLTDPEWLLLTKLQHKAGNLSCESQTILTSGLEIMATDFRLGSGYARILSDWFVFRGFHHLRIPQMEEVEVRTLGGDSSIGDFKPYDWYLERYDVGKHP